MCITNHLCSHCRVFSYGSKRVECDFYTLKLLKSIFIVGKIKEAIVGEAFPDRAYRTTLTWSHLKVPQVQCAPGHVSGIKWNQVHRLQNQDGCLRHYLNINVFLYRRWQRRWTIPCSSSDICFFYKKYWGLFSKKNFFPNLCVLYSTWDLEINNNDRWETIFHPLTTSV